MMTWVALLLLQSAPAAEPVKSPVKLVVPAGACKPMLDGAAVTLEQLRAATGTWIAEHRQVRFEPHAKADAPCMQDVLKLLADAGAGDKFPIAFVGNDGFSGLEGE